MSYLQRLVDRAASPTSAVGSGAAPMFPPVRGNAPTTDLRPPLTPAMPAPQAASAGDVDAHPAAAGDFESGRADTDVERAKEHDAPDRVAADTPMPSLVPDLVQAVPVASHTLSEPSGSRDRPSSIGPDPAPASPDSSTVTVAAPGDPGLPSSITTNVAHGAPPSVHDPDTAPGARVDVASMARPAQNERPVSMPLKTATGVDVAAPRVRNVEPEMTSSPPIDVYIDTIEIVSGAEPEAATPAASDRVAGFADYAAVRMYDWGD